MHRSNGMGRKAIWRSGSSDTFHRTPISSKPTREDWRFCCAKDPEGVSEVVNDLDGELTNFWSILKDQSAFENFKRQLESTAFSEVEFDKAAENDPNDSPVDRAVKFFIRCRQSRQGLKKDFATLSKNRTRRGMNEQVSSWLTAINGLPEIHERLKRVVILNEDATTVIRREDSPNTLFYLDPPYVHETRVTTKNYVCEMSTEDHKKLLAALAEIQGKFILSGYRNDMYDEFAEKHGWQRVDREIDCKASSAKEKPKRIESLWMNFTNDDVRNADYDQDHTGNL
jgi:DNA adenine methylase